MLVILDRRGNDLAFKITISKLSGINLSNHKSATKVKTKELNVQSCNVLMQLRVMMYITVIINNNNFILSPKNPINSSVDFTN